MKEQAESPIETLEEQLKSPNGGAGISTSSQNIQLRRSSRINKPKTSTSDTLYYDPRSNFEQSNVTNILACLVAGEDDQPDEPKTIIEARRRSDWK